MESAALLRRTKVCHSAMLLSWAVAKQTRPQLHNLAAVRAKKRRQVGMNLPLLGLQSFWGWAARTWPALPVRLRQPTGT